MIDFPAVLAAVLLGLLGAGHCVGMCGGIIGALSFSLSAHTRRKRWLLLLGYNIGRIGSYTLMGAGLAALVAHLPASPWPLARTVAGLLLVLMGLYMADWWRVLTRLEQWGQSLWRWIKPLGNRLLPVDTLPKTLALGALWGWLPCGLVYSALAYAAVQPSSVGGGLVMLAFGMGTLPAVMVGGLAAERLRRGLAKKSLRKVLGVAFMLFGLWTVLQAWGHHLHHHSHHGGEAHDPQGPDTRPLQHSDHHHH